MRALKPNRRHLVGMASLTCSLAFSSLTFAGLPVRAQSVGAVAAPTACPVLSVANPSPGDKISEGGLLISGTAYDPAATSGSGIARVDLFLGRRDGGGPLLGSAVPGAGGMGNPRAFSVLVQVPDTDNGTDFSAYAISAITGQETVVSFPVFVGVPTKSDAATPTPIPTSQTITTSCPKQAQGASAGAVPALPAVGVATPAVITTGVAAPSTTASLLRGCPVLSVANPSPGDKISEGGLLISGTAYDPAATSGSGIARVDLFLGRRDGGGPLLGSAVPGAGGIGNPRAFSVLAQVPDTDHGTDFSAYAISAITGQETVVSFPVFVGTPTKSDAATPTPIPTTQTITTSCTGQRA